MGSIVTGLDIGKGYAKIVQLKKIGRRIELVNLGWLRPPDGGERDEFVRHLKKALSY